LRYTICRSKTRQGQFGFFDLDKQLAKIYQNNDFLPKLNSLIDWEMFRPILSKVRKENDPANGGRPPFNVVLMFEILVIKKMYTVTGIKLAAFLSEVIWRLALL